MVGPPPLAQLAAHCLVVKVKSSNQLALEPTSATNNVQTGSPLHQTPYFSFKWQLFLCAVFQSFFLNPTILYHIAHTFGPAQEVSL